MRKVILDLAVTLDGYIEGPNGEIDWCIMDEEMAFGDFLAGIDAIFYGRKSYDAWGTYQPDEQVSTFERDLWQAVHAKQKYVFTTQDRQEEGITVIRDDIAARVAEIKQQPGQAIWLYGGASLITTFLELNLIDQYRISVHPVVLGGGKPLFEGVRERLNLRLDAVNRFRSGVVQLIYSTV